MQALDVEAIARLGDGSGLGVGTTRISHHSLDVVVRIARVWRRELVRRTIAHAAKAFPGQGIRISAQSRLEAFYQEAGFVVVGDRYLEDGIPHTQMLLPAS